VAAWEGVGSESIILAEFTPSWQLLFILWPNRGTDRCRLPLGQLPLWLLPPEIPATAVDLDVLPGNERGRRASQPGDGLSYIVRLSPALQH
jgi:hypothetical protein